MECIYGTSSNCAGKGKKTAVAGGPGCKAVDAVVVKKEKGDGSDKENEEGNLTPEKELGDTPRSKTRVSKRQKQSEKSQKQIKKLLDKDDDDIDVDM